MLVQRRIARRRLTPAMLAFVLGGLVLASPAVAVDDPAISLVAGGLAFDHPNGVAVDPAGNAYIADTDNDRVRKVSPSGAPLLTFGSTGSGPGQFKGAEAMGLDGAGTIFVAALDKG